MKIKYTDIFNIILLIARPAAGKSEIIHYLSELNDKERLEDYHIGKLIMLDDFPYLWRWFEEDELLSQMGKQRLYSDKEGYFKESYLWDLLIKMINLEYEKILRDQANMENSTILIEFSRGKEHGGYKHALPQLSNRILERSSILYVDVPWEESLRKNRKRFNPDKPDSILEHSLPDRKLEKLYRYCDFKEIIDASKATLSVNDHEVPYAIFDNHDDVTTAMDGKLGLRLKEVLDNLWKARNK